MPDTGCLFFSVLSVVLGMMFFMFHDALLQLSRALNRTLTVLDDHLMRYRYALGVAFFLLSYGLFRLALILPELRS